MSVPAVDKIPSYATIPEQPAAIPIRPPEFDRASARSIRRSIGQALSSQSHSHLSIRTAPVQVHYQFKDWGLVFWIAERKV